VGAEAEEVVGGKGSVPLQRSQDCRQAFDVGAPALVLERQQPQLGQVARHALPHGLHSDAHTLCDTPTQA